MPPGRASNRTLADPVVGTELFFPSDRGIGSLREAFSDGETQLVDCASSMFQHDGPAWQKVSACWAPTQGSLRAWHQPDPHSVPCVEDTDKAYRVGIEHSVLGCTEEEGWGSLNSEQSTLSPGHLTGGHRAQQHRKMWKMSSVSISSFLIYQGENSVEPRGGCCFLLHDSTHLCSPWSPTERVTT